MRLYLTVFPALIGPLGLFVYGFSVAAVRTPTCLKLLLVDKHKGRPLYHSLRRSCLVRIFTIFHPSIKFDIPHGLV